MDGPETSQPGRGRRPIGRDVPTSLDVARRAGVSQSVVSRVFSDRGRVSAAAVAKVRAAAEELGYRPNALARSLITGRSNIIGLVMGEVGNPFYFEVIEQLSPALQGVGLHLMVFSVPPDGSMVGNVIAGILDYKVDGMIMASAALPDGLAERCIAEGLPVVFFGRGSFSDDFSSITTNGFEGGRLAARHLLETGRQRIAHIAGHPESRSAVERRTGFEAELEASGVAPAGIATGNYTEEGAEAAARLLFDRFDHPDGLFVANDMMAFAVIDTLRFELGLRVPEDVGVVGFDGVRFSERQAYDLTTVVQDISAMVAATVEFFAPQGESEPAPRFVDLGPKLVVRGSSRSAEARG